MSNTQKKQAKRKARKKTSHGRPPLSVEAIARATGRSQQEIEQALETLKEKQLIQFDGSGHPVLSAESLESLMLYEATGILVTP